MNSKLEHMAKGLIHHFLRGGTVEQAIHVGEQNGLPQELLQSFPAMMFQCTSAAGAVYIGEKTVEEVVRILVQKGAQRDVARTFVALALDYIRNAAEASAEDMPIPEASKPWFAHEE
jgi:hypothetical protein